jgi:hypothetical protein
VTSTWLRTIKQYIKGFFLYSLLEGAHAERRCLDELFMVALFSNAIGFPGLFNYYHLRLFPYYVRHLEQWKRRVLRERDFFDQIKD